MRIYVVIRVRRFEYENDDNSVVMVTPDKEVAIANAERMVNRVKKIGTIVQEWEAGNSHYEDEWNFD